MIWSVVICIAIVSVPFAGLGYLMLTDQCLDIKVGLRKRNRIAIYTGDQGEIPISRFPGRLK